MWKVGASQGHLPHNCRPRTSTSSNSVDDRQHYCCRPKIIAEANWCTWSTTSLPCADMCLSHPKWRFYPGCQQWTWPLAYYQHNRGSGWYSECLWQHLAHSQKARSQLSSTQIAKISLWTSQMFRCREVQVTVACFLWHSPHALQMGVRDSLIRAKWEITCTSACRRESWLCSPSWKKESPRKSSKQCTQCLLHLQNARRQQDGSVLYM